MTGSHLWGAVIFYCKCRISLIGDGPFVVSLEKLFFCVVFDQGPARIFHQAFVAVFKGAVQIDDGAGFGKKVAVSGVGEQAAACGNNTGGII